MTFGWVLSTHSGERLVSGSSAPPGLGDSHRAESFGLLALSVFLNAFQAFTYPMTRDLSLYTDNLGLVTRICSRQQYQTSFPSATLAADWDLIEEIYHQSTLLPSFPVAHVKGHQDDKVPYEQLPLPAQLNVDADALASSHVSSSDQPFSQLSPLFPHTRAQLDMASSTIHSHYRQNLHTAYSLPSYYDGICINIQNNLKTTLHISQLDTSLWHNFHLRLDSLGLFPFKFFHFLLPTQSRKSRSSYTDPHCIHCGSLDDHDHFLQCTHTSIHTIRTKFLQHLSTFLRTHTTHSISTLIISSLEQWLHISSHTPPSSEPLRTVFTAQSAIGWNLFLRGYHTPLWDLLPCPNSTWRTKMLTLIYTDLHQLWQAHNDLYHASTLKRWEQDKHRRLAATITFLHTLKPKALARDRDDLFIPDFMSELPTYTSAYMESWIRQYEPAIRASVQEATSQSISNMLNLTKYFTVTKTRRTSQRANTLHDAHSKKKRSRKRTANKATQRNTITKFIRFQQRPRSHPPRGPTRRLQCISHS